MFCAPHRGLCPHGLTYRFHQVTEAVGRALMCINNVLRRLTSSGIDWHLDWVRSKMIHQGHCNSTFDKWLSIFLKHVFLHPGGHFTEDLCVHNWTLMKILFFIVISILMIQSGHNFAHVMKAELFVSSAQLWLIRWSGHHIYARGAYLFMRFGLRAHKPFVKWVPDYAKNSNVLHITLL